jgi:BCD family chlorophyll transporter-like MFS transporter
MMQHRLQFTLQKVAIAWMFALLTVNFPYVTIFALGVPAVLIGLMLGLYPFFGPFQPLFGRFTQSHPVFGYYRTPYLLLGFLVGSLIFPFIPQLTLQMSEGSWAATVMLFLLFFIFGICIALMANTFLDLLSDVTTDETRSSVTASAWTGQTLAIAAWAFVFRLVMPVYSPEAMFRLYSLTPVVVMVIGILSVVGLEPRGRGLPRYSGDDSPLSESLQLLTGSPMARRFFLFIALSLLSIFLQDILQEPLGGELYGMTAGQTTSFQIIFNTTVAIGMTIAAIVGTQILGDQNRRLSMDAKKRIATYGGLGTIVGFLLLASSALLPSPRFFQTALFINGLCVGVFTFGSVTMMVDMTVEGKTGKYLGIWSLAQAVGLGLSFMLAGLLHTLLIGSGLLAPSTGYATIFALEAITMAWCIWTLQPADARALEPRVATT